MRGLDETDRKLLRALLEDGRRPYSELAESVDLSAPAVSDRVDRLRELGLIRRFTVDLDRTQLHEGTPVLVTLRAAPGTGNRLLQGLRANPAVEHAFLTADETVLCTAVVPGASVDVLFDDGVATADVRSYEVALVQESVWTPRLDDAELAPECVECGNTVSREGERERFAGELHHFCCSSCLRTFRERHDRLREGV